MTAPGVDRRPERVALAGLVVQLLLTVLTFLVFVHTGYEGAPEFRGAGSLFGELLHLVPGVAIWLLCYLRLRLERLAGDEQQEFEALRQRADASSSLFEASEKPDAYTAKGRLERLERAFVPAVTVLCGVAMIIVGVLVLGGWFAFRPHLVVERLAVSGAFLLAFAFVGFALSQYVIGLSSVSQCRNLRPAGAYLLSNSFLLALCALALWLYRAELPLVEQILARALPILVMLLGIEFLTNFLLDFFRPRLPGQELRPAYDSRLFGVFAQPGSLWNAIADTLDYQFGFRVSKTWFYSFVARLILPLLGLQLVAAVLLTCIVVVDLDQVVIVERLGAPRGEVLKPGLHLKLPWPFEQAHAVPAGRVQRLVIGLQEHAEERGGPGHDRMKLPENVHVWTDAEQAHGDYILLASRESALTEGPAARLGTDDALPEPSPIAGPGPAAGEAGVSVPVNALAVSLVVHFKIAENPPELFDYVYHQAEPERYLESLTYRELAQLASAVDLHDLMGPERLQLTQQLRERVQKRVGEVRLGIEVVYVGFLGLHPPVPVARSFESVVEAQELAQASVVEAESYAQQVVPDAKTEGAALVNEARARKFRQEQIGTAEEESFSNHEKAYQQASPAIYRSRYYFSALEEVLRGKRKIILSAGMAEEHFDIKLQDRLKADILDLDLGEE